MPRPISLPRITRAPWTWAAVQASSAWARPACLPAAACAARRSFRAPLLRPATSPHPGLAAPIDDIGRRTLAQLGKVGRAGHEDARELATVVQPWRQRLHPRRMPRDRELRAVALLGLLGQALKIDGQFAGSVPVSFCRCLNAAASLGNVAPSRSGRRLPARTSRMSRRRRIADPRSAPSRLPGSWQRRSERSATAAAPCLPALGTVLTENCTGSLDKRVGCVYTEVIAGSATFSGSSMTPPFTFRVVRAMLTVPANRVRPKSSVLVLGCAR